MEGKQPAREGLPPRNQQDALGACSTSPGLFTINFDEMISRFIKVNACKEAVIEMLYKKHGIDPKITTQVWNLLETRDMQNESPQSRNQEQMSWMVIMEGNALDSVHRRDRAATRVPQAHGAPFAQSMIRNPASIELSSSRMMSRQANAPDTHPVSSFMQPEIPYLNPGLMTRAARSRRMMINDIAPQLPNSSTGHLSIEGRSLSNYHYGNPASDSFNTAQMDYETGIMVDNNAYNQGYNIAPQIPNKSTGHLSTDSRATLSNYYSVNSASDSFNPAQMDYETGRMASYNIASDTQPLQPAPTFGNLNNQPLLPAPTFGNLNDQPLQPAPTFGNLNDQPLLPAPTSSNPDSGTRLIDPPDSKIYEDADQYLNLSPSDYESEERT